MALKGPKVVKLRFGAIWSLCIVWIVALQVASQHEVDGFRLWRKRENSDFGQLAQGLKLRTGEVTVTIWLFNKRFY